MKRRNFFGAVAGAFAAAMAWPRGTKANPVDGFLAKYRGSKAPPLSPEKREAAKALFRRYLVLSDKQMEEYHNLYTDEERKLRDEARYEDDLFQEAFEEYQKSKSE
jgi:hypothetical protein